MMPRARYYAKHDHDYRKTGEELCRKCGQPPAVRRVPVCPAHFVMKVSGLMTDYEMVRPRESGEQCEPCRVEDLP